MGRSHWAVRQGGRVGGAADIFLGLMGNVRWESLVFLGIQCVVSAFTLEQDQGAGRGSVVCIEGLSDSEGGGVLNCIQWVQSHGLRR